MEREILSWFDNLASLIADNVIAKVRERMPEMTEGLRVNAAQNTGEKYVRGNKALAEFLGVSPVIVCGWKSRGMLDSAIRSEYGRVIIYDKEMALECLNHARVKPGRRKRV